ncbi:ATP-binding cassette domain-containing protein [Limnochorda pilosa]|uniref:ABC transporter n=1 Tax=Limnochorda pilosa TaxID=1555112 RepID=A0A0K2SIP7_LIMPI|nr:ATP-binding cassette domain-containing protein [Limnochorda pilosa]BAS26965.1 ABC transporter [Limnochorda pilosa]
MTDPGQPIVLARNLARRLGSVEAVRGIDFAIRPRECYGFLAPNGAGKTTTIRMLTARIPRSGGSLQVLGHDVDRAPGAIKALISAVAQEDNLDEGDALVSWLQTGGVRPIGFRVRPATLSEPVLSLLARDALERIT